MRLKRKALARFPFQAVLARADCPSSAALNEQLEAQLWSPTRTGNRSRHQAEG